MTLTIEEIQAVVESILLVSSEPVPEARLVEVVRGESPETSAEEIRAALDALVTWYATPPRRVGLRVEEVASGFQFRSPIESAPFLRRFLSARPQKLSKAALETLAVIAYRQPVTKPDVESIRGVDVGAVLKGLLEHDLIRIIGKSEELGRPILYGTTKKFLELFGLRSLSALPTLREYHELDEDHQKQVDQIHEPERPLISDLAERQAFLVERRHDPDLDALAAAEAQAERAEAAAQRALDPKAAEAEAAEPAPASQSPESAATPSGEGGDGGAAATASEAAPGEAAPGEAAPGEAAPGEVAPREVAPGEVAPGEVAPREVAPSETTAIADGAAGDATAAGDASEAAPGRGARTTKKRRRRGRAPDAAPPDGATEPT
jgi:segregation and condensation protein B